MFTAAQIIANLANARHLVAAQPHRSGKRCRPPEDPSHGTTAGLAAAYAL
jgi:hypothetical protein